MPTIDDTIAYLQTRKRKYGGEAHCSRVVCMEEVRAKQLANEPDEQGRRRTRISLQTYSPTAYQDWAAFVERLMKRCSHNPLLFLDLLGLLVMEAEMPQGDTDGIAIALDSLCKTANYGEMLHAAKEALRVRKQAIKEAKNVRGGPQSAGEDQYSNPESAYSKMDRS